jgi:ABC-type transporter Mla subunit MlaD
LRPKSDAGPVADTATAAEVEALKAELEELKAQLTNTDTKLNDTLKAAAAAVEGDA